MTAAHRGEKIKSMYANLDVIHHPGMTAIKQCEIYTNVQPILPDEYTYVYPRPTEDIISMHKRGMATKRNGKN